MSARNGNERKTVYLIKNADGEVVAEHHRKDKNGDKTIKWKLPGTGPGDWGLQGMRSRDLPLYGSEQVKLWDQDDLVVLVEGEKARDALANTDYFNVLGTVCGSSVTPSPEVLEILRDRRVAIWGDTDEGGRKHVQNIAEQLHGVAAEVLIYTWHEAPMVMKNDGKPKAQDAADHPAVQSQDPKGLDRLLNDLEGAPRWEPAKESHTINGSHGPGGGLVDAAARGFKLTDLGNAQRLAHMHGEDIRYVYEWNRWLVFTGKRWEVDRCGHVERKAKTTVRSIDAEASMTEDEDRRKALRRFANTSEAKNRIRAMMELARSEPEVPVTAEELDADLWLLNCANGTLDLRTGRLRDHRREDLLTKHAPVEYDPNAEAPAWEAFLERVLPSAELRGFVQRAVGYSLTGDTRERVLFILHGMGRNGKSTILEAIREALGAEDGYALKTPAETLMAKPAGGIPNDVARLKGARFVSASETEKDRRLAESLVKEMTGNDTMSARFMRAEWFEFRPTHKVWLATNHKPEIKGNDPGIWDRIRLVPFNVRIPDDEIDRELPEKLKAELPGILAWAVRGCLDWQREGLGEPEEVRVATDAYRDEMDTLAAFIGDRCVVHPNAEVASSALYEAYQNWCEESGERAEKKRNFGTQLTDRGFERDRGTGNVHIRRGIGLRSDREPDPDGGSDPTGGKGHSEKSLQSRTIPGVGNDPSDLSDPESGMNSLNSSYGEVNPESGSLGSLGSLEAFLENPPRWWVTQAKECLRQGSPERLVKPLANAVATEVYGSPFKWREVLPGIEAKLEEMPR